VFSEIEQKKIVKGVNDVHKLCCFGDVCVRINDKHKTESVRESNQTYSLHTKREL
jgi:hypothetical protein